MREICTHKLNGLNDELTVEAIDEPGDGGACHNYSISGPCLDGFPRFGSCEISFQNGPILEAGVNGISQEALLSVVIDRLQGFQSGKFKCRENAIALTKLEEALHWLQHRTRDRLSRAVEGTHQL